MNFTVFNLAMDQRSTDKDDRTESRLVRLKGVLDSINQDYERKRQYRDPIAESDQRIKMFLADWLQQRDPSGSSRAIRVAHPLTVQYEGEGGEEI